MSSEQSKDLPKCLRSTLLSNEQQKAIAFACGRDKSIIIAPTGVGKTIIRLSTIAKLKGKWIVTAPPKVLTGWIVEAKKWEHTKHLKLVLLTGSPEKREELLSQACDVLLISLNSLDWLLHQNHGATAILIDELSKGAGKQTAALKTRKCDSLKTRIGLTATPVSENFEKLFPILRIIDKGEALGTNKRNYLEKYFFPTDYKQYNWALSKGSDTRIMDKIKHLICDVVVN